MKVSKNYLNFQPCTLEGAEANKWRWFEEGSTGDSRVLQDALRRQNKLESPTGKYFLVDAGYTNGPRFLAPYRGTRYHLNEWIGNIPQSYKELFNLHHASARNAIERATGHGAETAMDVDEEMSRETNELEFMGLGATATIDLEEPSSSIKGERQGSTSSGTHSHKRKIGEK
ncbi:hypothetical protein D0Y65_022058 [Glycine soja]|uniref:DDE Tnp4 domain-containing protein n=1 Tax=Glycine soja TaxID=3848 RepID=A0A445JM12_GLYSO|nr:hypothetical protein D0Y65_022058 [Glycine soja]